MERPSEIAPLPGEAHRPTTYVHATAKEAPARAVRILQAAYAVGVSTVRMVVGLLLATLCAPLLGPALLMLLPDCRFVRALERLATRTVSYIAWVSGVICQAGAKCDTQGYRSPRWAWLGPPVIRKWVSPLVKSCDFVCTYDQPGRWMSLNELRALQATLYRVATEAMDSVPHHRLFDTQDIRGVFSNRIISVAYDHDGSPLGFTALCYLPSPYGDDFIVHLGLTMIVSRARGQRLQTPLFSKCLTLVAFNYCRLSYTVTNIGASPAGIGSVADYFLDVYPHYESKNECTAHHLAVARHVLRYFRHEFGCSMTARFDENTFVVHGSNAEDGGGAAAFIKEDGKPVSRHKNPICNAWVLKHIDLTAGDELFQVGQVHTIISILRFLTRNLKTKRNPNRKA